jgi:dienelactone hydrolase
VTADVLAVRAAVQEGPPLALTGGAGVIRGAFIDDLLGLPAEDRPGIDVPPLAGTGGTRAIVHGSIAEVHHGAFLAPRLVEGSGTETGVVRRDAAGRIVAGPREPVPFVLTIPAVEDRQSLPLVIAHHGFNASRTTGFATAETAARAGVALLAIDAFQHGDRAVSARDEVNAMRGGIPGADGYAETDPLDVSGRVFGILGTAPGLAGFTGYPHGTLLQFAADVFSAVRLVRDGTLATELFATLVPTGFDPERIGFVGNSLGAVVGASVLVAEPDVRAAVQNVPPGSVVETLAESPEFRPLVEAIFLPLLGIEGPFDEVERSLLMDPIVDLTRWVLEPVDPLALAPYLFRAPVRPNGAAEILFQVAATDEVAAPLATASMVEASGAPRVTRWDPAAHGMLEVLLQESRWEPPVVPPFRARAAVLPIENPIVALHGEIEAFLGATLGAGP